MSGGHFDYSQHIIQDTISTIEKDLKNEPDEWCSNYLKSISEDNEDLRKLQK
jgi:hypothetical protein